MLTSGAQTAVAPQEPADQKNGIIKALAAGDSVYSNIITAKRQNILNIQRAKVRIPSFARLFCIPLQPQPRREARSAAGKRHDKLPDKPERQNTERQDKLPDKLNSKIMEQLNRIELRGIVGLVRMQEFEEKRVAHISLATTYAYKGKDGEGVIETTWHNVTAWEGRNMCDFNRLTKGCRLQVSGRMKTQKYTGSDGVERMGYEVIAKSMSIIEDDASIPYDV